MESLCAAVVGLILIVSAVAIGWLMMSTLHFDAGTSAPSDTARMGGVTSAMGALTQDILAIAGWGAVIVLICFMAMMVEAGFKYASNSEPRAPAPISATRLAALPAPVAPAKIKRIAMPGTAATAKAARLERTREKVLNA